MGTLTEEVAYLSETKSIIEEAIEVNLQQDIPAGTTFRDYAAYIVPPAASAIANTPAGNIAATTVQAAINELDTEKEAVANKVTSMTGSSTDTQYPSAKSVYNSTMRLLISRTIGAGENVSAITWTQDDAGHALALIDATILIKVPSNILSVGTSATIRIRFNDFSGASDYITATTAATMGYAGYLKNQLGISRSTHTIVGGLITGMLSSVYTDGVTLSQVISPTCTTFSISAITKIYLYLSNLAYFPDGTIIQIYGRTA